MLIPIIGEDQLPGLEQIQSMARLLWRVDPKNLVPVQGALKTQIENVTPGNIGVPKGFDKILTATVGATQSETDQSQQQGGLLGALAKLFDPQNLDANTVAAVATVAGHPEIALAAAVLIPYVQQMQKSGEDTSGNSSENLVPNYAGVLGIDKLTTMSDLIGNFRGHSKFLVNNYTGDTLEALGSLLIIGYSQAYTKNILPALN